MQFLRAVSHAVTHTDALQLVESDSKDKDDVDDTQEPSTSAPQQDSADTCEVCLLAPRSGVALVPCGHSCFCTPCADSVTAWETAVLSAVLL